MNYRINQLRVVPPAVIRILSALPALAMLAARAHAGTPTWDASGANPAAPTDGAGIWDPSAVNWSNGSMDNGWNSGDSAVIGANNGAAGIISITNLAGVTVSNITYNAAGSGSYNIAGTTLILSGFPTISVAAGVSATNSLILGGTGFAKTGSGMLVLIPGANNTNAGATTVNAGTLNLAAGTDNRVELNGDVVVNSGGVVLHNSTAPILASATLTLNGGTITNTASGKILQLNRLVLNGGILGSTVNNGQLNLTNIDARSGTIAYPRFPAVATTNFTVKSTTGTIVAQGGANNAGSQGYVLTMNGGTFVDDYLNPGIAGDTFNRARFISSGFLTLGGGTLRMIYESGPSTGGRTESVAGTRVQPGASALQNTNNIATGGLALNLVAITRNSGGTLDISTGSPGGAAATFNTTSVNVNGILGGWATWASQGWATGGGNIAAYAGYQTDSDPTLWGSTSNVTLSASPSGAINSTTINSLRLTGTATVTINPANALTLSSGGLLVTGSGANTITGGTLQAAPSGDIIIQDFATADLTIASALSDNTAPASLTKSGPGKLILSGANILSGTNYLNGGTVEVADLSKLASGPLVMNNGTLRYTGTDTTSSRAVALNGAGATFDVVSGTTVTQTGTLTGSGGVNSPYGGFNMGDWGGLTKIGPGKLVLAANNVYNGSTVVSNGVLSVNGTNSLSGTSGLTNYLGGGAFFVYGGTLGGTGIIAGPVTIKNGGTIAPGNSPGTLTLATNLTMESGSTGLFDVGNSPGANDLLVVQGNLVINSGSTIALNVSGLPLSAGTITLIQYSGTKAGSFNSTPVITGGSIDGSYSIDDSIPGQINLVVIHQVTITSQPVGTNVVEGQSFTVSVAATGTAPLTYQWYFTTDTNVAPGIITNANASSYTVASSQSSNTGFYQVVVTNNYNAVTSLFAFVNIAHTAPALSGPTNQTVIAGNDITFSATLTAGAPAPTFQWYFGNSPLPENSHYTGTATTSLTIHNTQYPADQGIYSLVAMNDTGTASNSASLTVYVTPSISPQPSDISVNAGSPAVLTSGAGGVPAPSLQWYKNGLLLPGQNGTTLSIASAQGSDIGSYTLVASNAAGVVTSSAAKLTVYSTTLAATAMVPANSGTGVCVDTPLYVTFNGNIGSVNAGLVQIFNVTNPATPVDTIDMSANITITNGSVGIYNVQTRTIGGTAYRSFPVLLIDTNLAAIYPHAGVLANGQSYYVIVSGGVFTDAGGAYFAGITNNNAWTFTTKASGPANPNNLTVAADGSGDFCTIQGAVDSLPANNSTYTLVSIRNGIYREIVFVNTKNHITFRGQDRHQTVVSYVNNDPINSGTSLRPMFRIKGDDIAIENITLTNATPKGGLQAEALRVGDGSHRFIGYNADFDSYQDTILVNNSGDSAYFQDSHVQGDTDFIWGSGTIYFTNCEIMCMSSQSHVTQARTDNTTNGIAFIKCQIVRASPSVTSCDLGRDGGNGFPYGQVVYVSCSMDTNAIMPAGWIDGGLANKSLLRFWEYQSTDLTGTNLIDVSQRAAWSQQISFNTATNVEDVTFWLYGFLPQLAPNILNQPGSLTVAGGAPAAFNVTATGIPNPAYQWYKNGTPINGQTAAAFSIATAYAGDAAGYTVVVSNVAGTITSANAVLTVGNTAPTLDPIPNYTVNPGVTVNVTPVATDPDVPTQTLGFSLLTSPANATIDPNTGAFAWRLPVALANTTNQVTIVVADNGLPVLSASQTFYIVVNQVTNPVLGSATSSGGAFVFTVDTATIGPDYIVQTSTNVINWQSIYTNLSPAAPFTFTNTDMTAPKLFYRVKLAP